MLQLQYYNHKLSQTHVEKILANYNIKYNTMKNEIEAKINSMIKLFVNEIRAFLENIEEIKMDRKRISEAENIKLEFAMLKARLEDKISNEQKLKDEINHLTKENLSLKTRIRAKANFIAKNRSKFWRDLPYTGSSTVRGDGKFSKSKFKKTAGTESSTYLRDKIVIKKMKIKKKNRKNNLSCSFEKKGAKNAEIKHTGSMTQRNNNNSCEKRIINNNKNSNIKSSNNKNKKNIMFQSTPANKTKNYNTTINKKTLIKSSQNDNKNKADELNNSFEIKPFDQSIDEDDSISDDVIEEEIKELETDEKDILSLLDQIKQLKHLKENF
jgi:hypothetical protein